MRAFLVYTLLRFVLFAACFGVLWLALQSVLGLFPLLLLALVASSILSVFVLRAARERFALTIEQRAARLTDRLDQSRRAEDAE